MTDQKRIWNRSWIRILYRRVADPSSFDPDPAFWVEFRSGTGSRVLMTKNLTKFTAEKNLFFLGSNYNTVPIPRRQDVGPRYRRSLQLSKDEKHEIF
jgi:hypothetical protein